LKRTYFPVAFREYKILISPSIYIANL
jgi:hypothetical protein